MMLEKLSNGKGPWFLQWLYNNLLGLSQTISTRLGGDPDESVSGRTGRAELMGSAWALYVIAPFINWLTFDPDHTRDSIEHDEKNIKEIWDWGRESIKPRHVIMMLIFVAELTFKVYAYYMGIKHIL